MYRLCFMVYPPTAGNTAEPMVGECYYSVWLSYHAFSDMLLECASVCIAASLPFLPPSNLGDGRSISEDFTEICRMDKARAPNLFSTS